MSTAMRYLPTVGKKFNEDGSVKMFPGNTIVCFVNPQSGTFESATWVLDELKKQPFSHKFTLLPPSSLHMTVMELLCDRVRVPERWSNQLALDAPLSETDKFFMKTVPTVQTPDNFRMRYAGLYTTGGGILISLQPADDATQTAITQYRHDIAAATGVRFPDHETYSFHMSLAYRLIALTDDEEAQLEAFTKRIDESLRERFGIFETGKPHLTFFDDMFAFVPVEERLSLKSRSEN